MGALYDGDMTTQEVLQKEFEKLEKDLVAKHIELGMRASGQWENSLETTIKESGNKINAKLEGLNYTEQLVFGRRPGKFPPVQAIEQWIQDKGISYDIPLKSLAFLIARKIAQEGTKYYQQGGTDLVEAVVTPERIQSIIDQIGIIEVDFIVKGLVTKIKELA